MGNVCPRGLRNKSHASLRVTVGKNRMCKRARTDLCEGDKRWSSLPRRRSTWTYCLNAKSKRSAWCKRLNSTGTLIQRTTMEAP